MTEEISQSIRLRKIITYIIKSRRMKWHRHVSCMEETRNENKMFVGKFQGDKNSTWKKESHTRDNNTLAKWVSKSWIGLWLPSTSCNDMAMHHQGYITANDSLMWRYFIPRRWVKCKVNPSTPRMKIRSAEVQCYRVPNHSYWVSGTSSRYYLKRKISTTGYTENFRQFCHTSRLASNKEIRN